MCNLCRIIEFDLILRIFFVLFILNASQFTICHRDFDIKYATRKNVSREHYYIIFHILFSLNSFRQHFYYRKYFNGSLRDGLREREKQSTYIHSIYKHCAEAILCGKWFHHHQVNKFMIDEIYILYKYFMAMSSVFSFLNRVNRI